MITVRDVTKEEAVDVINKVFDRCYNDKEPFGRTTRGVKDQFNCFEESYNHGYKD